MDGLIYRCIAECVLQSFQAHIAHANNQQDSDKSIDVAVLSARATITAAASVGGGAVGGGAVGGGEESPLLKGGLYDGKCVDVSFILEGYTRFCRILVC